MSSRLTTWSLAITILMTIALLAVPIRVAWMQVAPHAQLAESAGSNQSQRMPLVRRGDLLDRRGRLLATTTRRWRAFIDPIAADDPATLGARLGQRLGISPAEIDRQLAGKLDRRYVPVTEVLADWQIQRLRAEPISGVGLEPRPVRHYPQALPGASLIGLVGFEHAGLGGAEHALEPALRSVDGELTTVRDASRRTMWIGPDGFQPGRDGDSVRLSIDLAIQLLVEERLGQAVTALGAAGGRVVVMDPMTGELLAAADVLADTPPRPGAPEDTLRHTQPRLGRHRCVTDPYEPGSTFKPFVWALATQRGLASPDEMLQTPVGPAHRTSYGRRIRDAHYYGPSSWRKTLVKSLNSGMAIVAERVEHDAMRATITALGFGRPTGCGIPGETGGIVTPANDWSKYTQTSVAMGHEIAVTPVQMARAFCTFARDGSMPGVTILAVDPDATGPGQVVFDEETTLLTRTIMTDVMTQGTGRKAQSESYSMFGKSGTAQLPKAGGGGYHEDRYISSFIAGAPAQAPRIVVLCVIDDPDRSRGAWYGGSTAGPVVRDLVDRVLPYLGVAPDLAAGTLTAR